MKFCFALVNLVVLLDCSMVRVNSDVDAIRPHENLTAYPLVHVRGPAYPLTYEKGKCWFGPSFYMTDIWREDPRARRK